MKCLLIDKAKSSTITSTNSLSSYPPSNLSDRFLDRPYLSSLGSDIVELDYGSDTAIDTVIVAYCNAAFITVDVLSNAGIVVYTTSLNVKRPVETLYFTEVTGRKVRLTANISNGLATWVYGYRASLLIRLIKASPESYHAPPPESLYLFDGHEVYYDSSLDTIAFNNNPSVTINLKIKGVGFGVSDEYQNVLKVMPRKRSSSTRSVRSPNGQVMANTGRVFRAYEVTIPNLSRDEFRDIDSRLIALDTHNPTYFDLTPDSTDALDENLAEDPIYAEISDDWSVGQSGTTYDVTIPLLEAK